MQFKRHNIFCQSNKFYCQTHFRDHFIFLWISQPKYIKFNKYSTRTQYNNKCNNIKFIYGNYARQTHNSENSIEK